MQTNLVNLTTVYDTALGELFNNKPRLESFGHLYFLYSSWDTYLIPV